MSSELEKQFFIQREEPPEKPQVSPEVSPEKREEAIQYAREIRRIREKEILTQEDLTRVEELAKRIERIYSPEIQFESEEAKKRLEKLKETPLWDRKREQWNRFINENQELQSLEHPSHIQIIGVLAEAITGNLEGAEERLEKLKETSLWDGEKEQWNWSMDEGQEFDSLSRTSDTQLFGVLAEAITGNSGKAKERLKELKKTPLWDKKNKQWNRFMNENQELGDLDRYSSAQLLGVLAEAITGNLEEAKERLKELKKTPLWDEERKQWNLYIDENQKFQDLDCSSYSQLLGVLAEAVTGNPEEAKKRLEALKETLLWDKDKEQWNNWMNDIQKLRGLDRFSDAQLLGVLAEAFHEKEEEFVEWLTKKK